ncbi:MAG: hypothetical protein WD771_01280 [Gemmatimonadaceae bacterium]
MNSRRALGGIVAVLACLGGAARDARAQADRPERLTVFLDCRTFGCDRNFFIEELPYVLWTQDRLDAEVHALITGLGTAAGGTQFTIALLGQRRLAGRADTLVGTIPPNSSDDQRRREFARVLKVGLGPYLLGTAAGERLSLDYRPAAADSALGGLRGISDPWNFWVYRISANGNVGAESRASDYEVEASLSATRITEDWKIIFGARYEYEATTFELDSGSVSFALRSAEFESAFLKSVTEHWSVGTGLSFALDDFNNQDFAVELDVAAEWNYFPWREATRRQLVFIAGISNRYFDYSQETIYLRQREFRTAAVAKVAVETRQPWGSLFGGVEHIRYLHDTEIYSASVYLNMDVRISRGFSVFFGGNAARVNDQLYLPRGDASDDEILTRQRALATAYRVNAYAGVSFTFGSIFNTVVNPRFNAYP